MDDHQPIRQLPSIDEVLTFPTIDTSFFNISGITNKAGIADYPYCWRSTSAGGEKGMPFADYVAFGYGVDPSGNDTHAAGAVGFDTKIKDGPAIENEERVDNYV